MLLIYIVIIIIIIVITIRASAEGLLGLGFVVRRLRECLWARR